MIRVRYSVEQCNIAAEEVVAVESVGEGRIEEKGVGGEVVEKGVCSMESDSGAGDVVSELNGGGGGGIPEFTQTSGVMKYMTGMEPLSFFYELFSENLIEHIVAESNRYGQQYMDSHATYLEHHPRARAHQFRGNIFTSHEIQKVLTRPCHLHGDCEHAQC